MFRVYWSFLSPGIILIRSATLPSLRRAADRKWRVDGDDMLEHAGGQLTYAITIDAPRAMSGHGPVHRRVAQTTAHDQAPLRAATRAIGRWTISGFVGRRDVAELRRAARMSSTDVIIERTTREESRRGGGRRQSATDGGRAGN